MTGYHRACDPTNGAHHVDLFLWPDAPPGAYEVRLVGLRIARGRWDAWFEREHGTRQSRTGPGQAVRMCTTGSVCNGRKTIAVGAYDTSGPERSIPSFSSCGPTRDGRRKPDLVAPGRAVLAARSTTVGPSGRRSHGLVRKSGTSMAAPHVCGAIALLFGAALPERLSIDQTRDRLFASLRPAPRTDALTRMRMGRGLLDADALVASARTTDDLANPPPTHEPSMENPR